VATLVRIETACGEKTATVGRSKCDGNTGAVAAVHCFPQALGGSALAGQARGCGVVDPEGLGSLAADRFGMLVIIQPGTTPELGAALDRAGALRVAQIRPRFDPGGQAINGGAMLCGDGAKVENPENVEVLSIG
jgi:hypothetical protein